MSVTEDLIVLPGQVKGDGDPTCFSNVDDTGIPALQQWCHQLTIASRERAARNFLTHLSTFAKSVRSYVQGVGDVTPCDRTELRKKWESQGFINSQGQDEENDEHRPWTDFNFNLPGEILARSRATQNAPLYRMKELKEKLGKNGQPVGITPRLCKVRSLMLITNVLLTFSQEFIALVEDCVDDLKQNFQDGLEDKCRTGSASVRRFISRY